MSAKFLIHFEMWRDLKPLCLDRERELKEARDGDKGEKMSLMPIKVIFKMDRYLKFKKGKWTDI